MCSDFPRELSIESLETLMKVYLSDWPKHIVIHSTLSTFIQRFNEFPELKGKFKIFALSDDWESDGSFYASFDCTDIETCIYFDSLNDIPSSTLKTVLKSLNYAKLVTIFSVRNAFRSMLLDIINDQNLAVDEDTNTVCYYLTKCDAKILEMTLPLKTSLTTLNEGNVNKINASWKHSYDGANEFISYSINFHMSAGLFDDAGELLAWCMRYDNGSIGVLGVDPKHFRKGYGSVLVKAISKRIAEELDSDVTALIQHENEKSISMFKKVGFREAGPHSWFLLRKK